MTYMAVADRAVPELPRRQSADPRRHMGMRAPPDATRLLTGIPGPHADLAVPGASPLELRIAAPDLRIARHTARPTTLPGSVLSECVRNTGHVPSELLQQSFMIDTSTDSPYLHRMLTEP